MHFLSFHKTKPIRRGKWWHRFSAAFSLCRFIKAARECVVFYKTNPIPRAGRIAYHCEYIVSGNSASRAKKIRALASNEEWKAWGEIDPLYGVATIPARSRDGANPWTDEDFYRTGAADWEIFRKAWEQYGVDPARSCVEIGCGAGRMTVHLARYFHAVAAVDVSARMIAYARERVPGNVSFHETAGGEIPLAASSAGAVFSVHVLQHLSDVSAGAGYFREMYRVLAPGGVIMIHLPIVAWPWGRLLSVHKLTHRARILLDDALAHVRRRAFRAGLIKKPPMQVIWYEVSWLYNVLRGIGFRDLEIRILIGGSQMAVQHPFVMARKPEA